MTIPPRELENEVMMTTNDAAVIEMDIVSTEENVLSFYYIFAVA